MAGTRNGPPRMGKRKRQILEAVPPGRAIAVRDLIELHGRRVTKSSHDALTESVRSMAHQGFRIRSLITRDPLPKLELLGDEVEELTGGVSPLPGTLEFMQRTVPLLVVPNARRLANCPCCQAELFIAERRGTRLVRVAD